MTNNLNWLGNNVMESNNNTGMNKNYNSNRNNALPAVNSNQSMTPVQQTTPSLEGMPPPSSDPNYVPGFLAKNLGKNVRAEFYINNNTLDKVGRLIEVGANFFVLEDFFTKQPIMNDLYSAKFVTILDWFHNTIKNSTMSKICL